MHREESDIHIGRIFKFAIVAHDCRGVSFTSSSGSCSCGFESQAAGADVQYPLAVGAGRPGAARAAAAGRRRGRICTTYRRASAALLDGYRWVDKNAGVVRIPIDEAMKRVVAAGPAHAPSTTQASGE